MYFPTLENGHQRRRRGDEPPPYDTENGEYTDGSSDPDPDGTVVETRLDDAQVPGNYSRPPDSVADQRYLTEWEHTAPELPDGPNDEGDPSQFTPLERTEV